MRVFYGAVLFMITAAMSTSVSAQVIATQTFDTDQAISEDEGGMGYTEGISNNRDDYLGSGLGFAAAGLPSTTTGGINGAVGGLYTVVHMSSLGDVLDPARTGKYSVTAATISDVDRSAYLLFDIVDMSGFDSSTFTMDLGELGTASPTGDQEQDMLVRMYVDDVATDLFHWDGDGAGNLIENLFNGATFNGGVLSFAFDDSVNSAELFIAISTDDLENGFTIDNVAFNGTAIPEPASLAVLGIAGLGFLVRRRR